MGEDSNRPMNAYIFKDGQTFFLGSASSIEFSDEDDLTVLGMDGKGNEIELMNLSYLGATSSLAVDVELDHCNLDLLLEIGAPQSDVEKLRAQSEQELEEARTRTEQVRAQLGKGEIKQ